MASIVPTNGMKEYNVVFTISVDGGPDDGYGDYIHYDKSVFAPIDASEEDLEDVAYDAYGDYDNRRGFCDNDYDGEATGVEIDDDVLTVYVACTYTGNNSNNNNKAGGARKHRKASRKNRKTRKASRKNRKVSRKASRKVSLKNRKHHK